MEDFFCKVMYYVYLGILLSPRKTRGYANLVNQANHKFKENFIKKTHDNEFTGERLENLENDICVQSFLKALKQDQKENYSSEAIQGFYTLVSALIDKNQDSQGPISGAHYSSILVYKIGNGLRIHAGANIDPSSVEHFDSKEHRRCAERQAALSAQKQKLSNEHLDLMFLYRRPEEEREHTPEMLVPCSDCAVKYLNDLKVNRGKLIVILPDDKPREFLMEEEALNNHHLIQTVKASSGRNIYYKIIDSQEIPYLKLEASLGSKAKGSEGSITNLDNLIND